MAYVTFYVDDDKMAAVLEQLTGMSVPVHVPTPAIDQGGDDDADPWRPAGNGSSASLPAARVPSAELPASAPGASSAQSAAGGSQSVLTVRTKFGVYTYTLNPPGGPDCDCGEPAALVHGPSKDGGTFDAYRCAKGAGDAAGLDWRRKCRFSRWT